MPDSVPDPNGAAEEPDCGQLQRSADALRMLLDSEHTAEHRRATIQMAADTMELMIDWLLEQHRIIAQLQEKP